MNVSCPKSFYRIYDYWGYLKIEGRGGGLQALKESNKPVGIFMKYKNKPIEIWVVNDLLKDLGNCKVRVVAIEDNKKKLLEEDREIEIGPDSSLKVSNFNFPIRNDSSYFIKLEVFDSSGCLLAENTYYDPFKHPKRPEYYPERMDHEIGMRLW